MSKGGDGDERGPERGPEQGMDRTVQTPVPAPRKHIPSFEAPDTSLLEEPTIQGASFLVERITPVPPTRDTMQAPEPRKKPSVPPVLPRGPSSGMSDRIAPSERATVAHVSVSSVIPLDAPTAAVINPGLASRPPPASSSGSRATEIRTGALRIDPASVPQMDAAMKPLSRNPGQPTLDVDTAYVPLPGQGGPPTANPGQATVVAGSAPIPPKKGAMDRIKGSKNARLALIAGCGILGIALVLVLFTPHPRQELTPTPVVNAEANLPPEVKQPPPKETEENVDPAKLKEKDTLLERAILAVEGGKTEEALALFRRYTEEEANPAAEFMVQILQAQQLQSEKEK